MTESEWLSATHPRSMLEFLRGKASDRKLRLFACACCRRTWNLLRDVRSQQAIEIAERYADGLAGEEELRAALGLALAAHQAIWNDSSRTAGLTREGLNNAELESEAALAVWRTCKPSQAYVGSVTIAYAPLLPAAYAVGNSGAGGIASERAVQASLLRDIFGSLLFRSVSLPADWLAWQDRTLRRMAQAIYDERAFDRLPVLADALEEAGCNDPDILGHCRQPGPHFRGCWVVDLLSETA
jgi:hypothetical protein